MQAFKFVIYRTMPVLFGYLFLGMAFGILLQKSGYDAIWALFISVFVYAGSMQFVLVSFLTGGASLITVAVMTFLVNSRHIFYGLSFIDTFKKMGNKYYYMIFSLTDETYSLLCSLEIPEGLDTKKTTFCIALMNQAYWVIGSLIGGLAGQWITFNTTGIEFAMTALFVVIFVEQWKGYKNHVPAITGLISGIICLMLFGSEQFILPSLIITVTVLILSRGKLENENVFG